MSWFSTALTALAGVAMSPYLTGLIHRLIPEAPDWFPYVGALLISGVVYAVGLEVIRGFALSVAIGVLLFGLAMQYYPLRFDFFGVNIPGPF